MKFGDYLRRKREEKDWTQPEAAVRAEIEQSYLSKLETGKSWPSEDVFARLVAAYGVDLDDLLSTVASTELAKLKDVGDVRAAILDRQRSQRVAARGWLAATLACLMIGGGCLGVAQLARDAERVEYVHSSMGVLRADEPLDAFSVVNFDLGPEDPQSAGVRALQQDMIARIDVETRISSEKPPTLFLVDVPGGRRNFQLADVRTTTTPSPLRWFLVPAFAFLIGSAGCAFVSLRWK